MIDSVYCDASKEAVFKSDCKKCCLLAKQGLKPSEVEKCQFFSELEKCSCECGEGVLL